MIVRGEHGGRSRSAARAVAAGAVLVLLGACADAPRAEGPAAAMTHQAQAQNEAPARIPVPDAPAARGAGTSDGAGAASAPAPRRGRSQPPASPYGDFLAARHAERIHDAERAAELFARTLRHAPDDPTLMRQTLHQMAAAGRIPETVELARRFLAADSESMIAGLVLAVDDLHAGRLSEAAARLDAIPRRGLGNYFVPLALSWVRAGEGRTPEALEALSVLGTRRGLSLFHDFHAALILDFAGDADRAATYFDKLAADGNAGYARMVELSGAFYRRQGDGQKAREVYRRHLRVQPDAILIEVALERLEAGRPAPRHITSAVDGVAGAMFDLATLLSQENVPEIAMILTRLALHLRPDFALAGLLLGDILESTGRRSEAIAAYRSVPDSSPLQWTARLRAAGSLDRLERVEEALDLLTRMAAEAPDRADALIAKGDILRYKKRYAEAVEAYDTAFARLDEARERHWSLYYSRGIALERNKQWPRAESDFLRALESQPDQPFVLNYLGYSWVEQGHNLERALRMIEKAVRLRPNDGYIVDSLGWAHYQLGAFDKAVTHLERAVELAPTDATINDHLGDAFWRVGRRAEARFQWQRALSLEPEPGDVAAIERKLAEGLGEPGRKREASGVEAGQRGG